MGAGSYTERTLLYGLTFCIVLGCIIWGSLQLSATIDNNFTAPSTPISMIEDLKNGSLVWPTTAIIILTIFALSTAGLLAMFLWPTAKRRFDRKAKRLPSFGLKPYVKGKGPYIGKKIGAFGQNLYLTEENQAVIIAGPRTGKTTTQIIPQAIRHDGPLFITSNKRDIVDTITTTRKEQGKVFLFDPQNIATSKGEQVDWYWDPLKIVTDLAAARTLAKIWADIDHDEQTSSDAYFDPAGQELLASLLLAAATDRRDLSDVYKWTLDATNHDPQNILQNLKDHRLSAESLKAFQDLPDKQKAGVYGTAQKIVSFAADPNLAVWFTPDENKTCIDITNFCDTTNTLICLSRKQQNSAIPLVTALTAAALEAAETRASQQPDGRLNPTLLVLLDEAANVCPLQQLPDLYSHYGSRGIIIISAFQSWAQIEDGYTKKGAEKLWDAANIKLYLGGVSDTTFLKRLSEICGTHTEQNTNHSYNRYGHGTSTNTKNETTLDVATLAAIPSGRALVICAGAAPTIIKTRPHWKQKT